MKESRKAVWGLLIVLAGALAYLFFPAACPEPARRTAFVFVLAALYWAFEIIPLFATSLGVILLLVFLLSKPVDLLNLGGNGFQIFFASLSNPVILLFLGGFVLAHAIQKHKVDQQIVHHVLPVFGTKPYFVMLGCMLVTGFLSFWMSHTAATAIMLAIIRPLFSHMDKKDPFRKALVLSIPFAANIGGIGTPVGTPPNAIAIGMLADHGIQIKFLSWMMMAVPLAFFLLITASFILFFLFPPKITHFSLHQKSSEAVTPEGKWVAWIFFSTIFLWLTSAWHGVPDSVIALLAVFILAISGLISTEDVNSIHWDILILMWGGLALGKAMEVSKLGEWILSLPWFHSEGFLLVATFCLLTVFVSVFISNTATVSLIVPLALSMAHEHRLLLVVMVALSSSFDMLLPISTPSNALAFSTHEVAAKDMMKAGSLIVLLAIFSLLVGYPFFIEKILRM